MPKKKAVKKKTNLIVPTSAQARINGKKGGKASVKAYRKKKKLEEIITALLDSKIPDKSKIAQKLKNIFPDVKIETAEDLMNVSMMAQSVVKGNVQAYNALYDRKIGKAQQSIDMTTDGESLNKMSYENAKSIITGGGSNKGNSKK